MVRGGLTNPIFCRTKAESPNTISTATGTLRNQIQQIEERCAQGQQNGEELRNKRSELLEVLRVFEMIEENEKTRTEELERDVAQVEQEGSNRYRAALGSTSSWGYVPPTEIDVFGPKIANGTSRDDTPHDKYALFHRLGISTDSQIPSPKKVIPEFCKRMIASLIPDEEDIGDTRARAEDVEDVDEIENMYTANPRAPLIPSASKGNGLVKRRYTKRVLAFERAKQKAAESWKAMPHKARRKLKAARMPTFAPKKTLAYTGEAIRSMASGLGAMGGLWNAHQRLEDGLPASQTWPDALQSFLSSNNVGRSLALHSDVES